VCDTDIRGVAVKSVVNNVLYEGIFVVSISLDDGVWIVRVFEGIRVRIRIRDGWEAPILGG
jgi:hypothetical protein